MVLNKMIVTKEKLTLKERLAPPDHGSPVSGLPNTPAPRPTLPWTPVGKYGCVLMNKP